MARNPSTQGAVYGTAEIVSTAQSTGVERLLKILAWELGILIFFLAYLAFARPQPGRYQFVGLRSEEAVFYDTATGRVIYRTEAEPDSGQQGKEEGEDKEVFGDY